MAKSPARGKTQAAPRLGSVIRRLREVAGLTQHALAKAAAVDQAVLARIEGTARAGVQFDTVCRLARALDVSLDALAAEAGLGRRSTGTLKPGSKANHIGEIAKARKALERALLELDRIE